MNRKNMRAFAVYASRKLKDEIKKQMHFIEESSSDEELKNKFFIEEISDSEYNMQILLNGKKALIKDIELYGEDEIIEKESISWLNRITALRYMDANGYLKWGREMFLPFNDRKFSLSRCLDDTNAPVNKEYISKSICSGEEAINTAFRYILIKHCMEYASCFLEIFKDIYGYSWILLPMNIFDKGSLIDEFVEEIDAGCFIENIEICGWLYEYYITDKRFGAFKTLKESGRIRREDISAATQVFTPKWIVKYMVQNSVLRAAGYKPDKKTAASMKYYIYDENEETDKSLSYERVRSLKIIDPCVGTAHILIYVFELLYKIYESYGISSDEIVGEILNHNIYGLDIDDDAVKISQFALIMAAMKYDGDILEKVKKGLVKVQICSVHFMSLNDNDIKDICGSDKWLYDKIKDLCSAFNRADEYGSLAVMPENMDFGYLAERILKNADFNMQKNNAYKKVMEAIYSGKIMSLRYDVCITNPPYMGIRNADEGLALYLKKYYSVSKYDLFSAYMEAGLRYIRNGGYMAMITPHSWMFLSSFLKFRESMIKNGDFINMLHLGSGAFLDDAGTIVQNTAFVYKKGVHNRYKTRIINLTYGKGEEKEKSFINKAEETEYRVYFKEFMDTPSKSLTYWIGEDVLKLFTEQPVMGDVGKPRQGIATSDNNRFLRLWHEVDINDIEFNARCRNDSIASTRMWFPYNKGGGFRKWYGNNEYVIKWKDDGREVKEYASYLYKSYSRTIKNEKFFFKKCLTYTFISEKMGVRYCPEGFIFDVAGSCIFFENDLEMKAALGLLCSSVSRFLLKMLNPTYNIQVGDVKHLPFHRSLENNCDLMKAVGRLTDENIDICREEWDEHETSWGFKRHPLVMDGGGRLEDIYNEYKGYSDRRFEKLKRNEEELNRIFIKLYGLQEYMDGSLKDEDISIRKTDRREAVKSLISYGVGCIFGRYTPYADGILYSGGDFSKAVSSIPNGEEKFMPINSNMALIDEEDSGNLSIAWRFVDFIDRIYGHENLEDNLKFIADSLYKEKLSPECAIRKYFLKGFYKDHIKRYKKRPIYWVMSSGKRGSFKSIFYIHRYKKETFAANIINAVSYAEEKQDMCVESKQECIEYKRKISLIKYGELDIDINDGVRKNYDKFQNLHLITGERIALLEEI